MKIKKNIVYNINIYYNIYKDCGGSLRTTPRRSRCSILFLFLFLFENCITIPKITKPFCRGRQNGYIEI